ncbi:MAG: carbohydrate kinase family protein [Planctomycetes bacterium]|nr:carbohydrate kinase family protein [Planctomycetota bacterium]
MSTRHADVVVAGHTCLDIIPSLDGAEGAPGQLIVPGTLVTVGPAVVATGGAVPNTGIALHRLGVAARLMGKLGDDLLGRVVLDILRGHDPALAEDMIVAPGEHTSYSVVINPPGVDRTFLHYTGPNDTFAAADLPYDRVAGARVFHFGYPPLMRRMFADGGRELATMLRKVRDLGVAVSLDMSLPDLAGEAGRADWEDLLQRVLPHVDLYLPSLDETLLMLERETFVRLASAGNVATAVLDEPALLSRLAGRLLEMGATLVALKLGDQGLYLRTTSDAGRLAAVPGRLGLDSAAWVGRERLAPCFEVEVAGTTGSGDCTIAGFLTALLHGLGPCEAMLAAVGVGACSVQQRDATSGLVPWEQLRERVNAGWPQRTSDLGKPWQWSATDRLWIGPNDASRT